MLAHLTKKINIKIQASEILKYLTFDFDTFESHGHTQSIFDTTSDLFVMVSSRYIEYLVIESILTANFPIIDKPLVAGYIDWGIGHSIAMESSLKKFEEKSRLETSDSSELIK